MMEDENNPSPTPRFGILNNEMKLTDDTYIKKLINTEKKKCTKHSEIQNDKKSKSKKKSPKNGKKNKSSKIKALNLEKCFEEFLKKKFKLRNDFDYEHTESFLLEKDNAMKNVELTDKIFE